jgi:transglutaminase-like putative cysteine protease
MRYAIYIMFFAVLCFAADWHSTILDDSLHAKIERNLDNAGENRIFLEEALVETDPSIRPGVAFLIANSPAINLVAFDKDSLIEEVRLAYEAKDRFHWGDEISDDLFLHYILPNQVSQEPLTYYRRFFLDQLGPILDTIETASQAAIAVNYWCGERVGFKQTQRQDQGVFHTLSSGYGRCEEMMIVYVSALRAVGIPAREAWTPYWATSDNNHAWTELYADGKWHFTGSCEPKPTLNNAWFNKTAKRAAVIMSSAFGVPEKGTDIIYRKRENYAIINSLPYYVDNPAILTVDAGAESTDVFLAVFNFGAIRPIMRRNTGDSTSVTLTVGHGDFILYAGSDSTFAWSKTHAEFGDTTHVALRPSPENTLGTNRFWLRYPVE